MRHGYRVILGCALLRASKDEYSPRPILRGSLPSHLRMAAEPLREDGV